MYSLHVKKTSKRACDVLGYMRARKNHEECASNDVREKTEEHGQMMALFVILALQAVCWRSQLCYSKT